MNIYKIKLANGKFLSKTWSKDIYAKRYISKEIRFKPSLENASVVSFELKEKGSKISPITEEYTVRSFDGDLSRRKRVIDWKYENVKAQIQKEEEEII